VDTAVETSSWWGLELVVATVADDPDQEAVLLGPRQSNVALPGKEKSSADMDAAELRAIELLGWTAPQWDAGASAPFEHTFASLSDEQVRGVVGTEDEMGRNVGESQSLLRCLS
jgi:hypothetical protein